MKSKKRQAVRPVIYKRLIPLMPNKQYLSGLLGIKAGLLVTGAITPVFYKLFVDQVLINKEIILIFPVVTGYVAMFVIDTGLLLAQRVVTNKCFQLFCARLRINILKMYAAMPAKEYEAFDVGDLNTRMQSDISACQDFFGNQIVGYLYHWGIMIVYGVVLLFISWPLALFGFAMIPFSFLLTKTLKKKGGEISEQYRNRYGQYEGFVHTSLQSWREVKALNNERQESDKFSAHWDVLSPLFVKRQIFWFLNRGVIAFKDLFITRMNIYFLGGLLILGEHLSVGGLLVFMLYYETLFASVSAIIDFDISLATQKPSIDRVLEILRPRNDNVTARTKKLQGFHDIFILKNVSFSYNEIIKVLHNINLSIKAGERIAVVGKSGSGKTTLAKLIMNIYEPIDGEVTVNGILLNTLEKQSLHRIIGNVAQEPFLFNLTIRDNLLMVDSKADDRRLDEACRMAQIYDFIHSLPDKYDTIIGERGIKLSVGQKQRLAIARAGLADTPFLIFDEATSALDYETEELVQKALDAYSRGRTVISIAHRLSAVKSCNRVIVLDNGHIVGDDSHENLSKECEVYQTLFLNQ
ncbi:ATP-binding cassette subfamily B protein/subfamily B ATP-binding cassette protein MsbA [Kineothrix alysoides]|uniref:ATP-binding cassette subfamily B protein/subfamily B ATP-binding cassette protein MsbA n=1 Tax=Kineothrix alysoides TaxID=1469948 RepID=A0A4R1QQX9_9FIRM|nr:ABC transporter ATP-binding protein [Kineothrix alysoides]TCL56188.1 ATP-binding cassette subfamily B protein/subfamily B ATP-binding cassette protein MsbA [Kineothrix alysoides]